MKRFRLAILVPSLLFAAASFMPAHAAPKFAPAAGASHREEIRSVCHVDRRTSRRRCTSAKRLMFVARPPLFYPHQYFGGTPHYAQRFHSDHYPYGRFRRWHGPRYGYPYYAY